MDIPKQKQRVKVKAKPSVESPSSSAETVKKVRPKRRTATSEAATLRVNAKFDENHVRWTGYLTVYNNMHVRRLVSEGMANSMTRFVNEAVQEHLKRKFGLSQENGDE